MDRKRSRTRRTWLHTKGESRGEREMCTYVIERKTSTKGWSSRLICLLRKDEEEEEDEEKDNHYNVIYQRF